MPSRAELLDIAKQAVAEGDEATANAAMDAIESLPKQQPQQSPNTKSPDYWSRVGQNLGDEVAGLTRGAGSIGSTLLWPVDKSIDAIKGDREGLPSRNEERRQMIDDGLQTLGADPESGFYKGGKLVGEIAGTAGVGSAIALPVKAAATVAPRLAPLADAIATSGMKAGGMTNLSGLATRAAGGAISGGASAGLVDPESAGTGAVIGGALPVALKGVGAAGSKIGRALSGVDQPAEIAAATKAARETGYVIPPTQANPTLRNRLVEGLAGKISTAQNASAKNQTISNGLAAKSLGMADDTKITPEVLQDIRRQAGQAYEAIGSSGTVTPVKSYFEQLDKISAPFLKAAEGFPNAKVSPVVDLVDSLKSQSFDASAATAKIKELRAMADDAFRTGNTDIARAAKSASQAIEDTLEAHLTQSGNQQALAEFRSARQLIAKTYSLEKALNPANGNIDAKKLAAQLKKGKPLSGELKRIAEFASSFPKAAQTTEGMGSLPQTSPLDWAMGGGMAAATSNPLMLASVMARPVARKMALSDFVQNGLVKNNNVKPSKFLPSPSAQQLGYQLAPLTANDR